MTEKGSRLTNSYLGNLFNFLGNPTRFMRFAERLIPVLFCSGIILTAYGIYRGIFIAPEDYQQGKSVWIMYIHVPSAWLAMMGYTMMSICALGTLVWRHPLAESAATAAAPIGAAFTFLALITGALWGKPTWGTYWVWDARLTSVLILLIMYLGLMSLRNAQDRTHQSARLAAILTLVGFINIPIIKFSVDWWNTLHQPASVLRKDGPSIDPSMLWPLAFSALGLTLLFLALHLYGTQTDILRRRKASLQAKLIRAEAAALRDNK